MNKNEISSTDAVLLLDKLMRESIPVVAFFVSTSGVQSKLRGFVDSITVEAGITVASEQRAPALGGYLSIPVGNPIGSGCRFAFGDVREIAEEKRAESTAKLGEAVLSVFLTDGNRLSLFFTP